MLFHVRQLGLRARSLIAATVAGCVLVAGWMVASPDLHERLHKDADHADHECLVTLISSGGMDQALTAPIILLPPVVIGTIVRPLHPQWVQPLFLDAGVLVHGPPMQA
jgi:hypothetical protein